MTAPHARLADDEAQISEFVRHVDRAADRHKADVRLPNPQRSLGLGDSAPIIGETGRLIRHRLREDDPR